VPIFVALAAMLAVGLGVLAFMRHRDAPAAAAVPVATSAPIATASSAPAPSATAAASVAVHVESTPDGANVFAFGRVVGTTPYVLDAPKSDQAFDIEVRKDGFVTQRESIVPNVEQRVRLTLPAAARAIPVRPQATTKPSATATASGFHRFD
jgi:serine/threonine-protein kinase